MTNNTFKDIELKWVSKWRRMPNEKVKFEMVDDWTVNTIVINPLNGTE